MIQPIFWTMFLCGPVRQSCTVKHCDHAFTLLQQQQSCSGGAAAAGLPARAGPGCSAAAFGVLCCLSWPGCWDQRRHSPGCEQLAALNAPSSAHVCWQPCIECRLCRQPWLALGASSQRSAHAVLSYPNTSLSVVPLARCMARAATCIDLACVHSLLAVLTIMHAPAQHLQACWMNCM